MNKKTLGALLLAAVLIIGGCGNRGNNVNSDRNAPDGTQKDEPLLVDEKDQHEGGSLEHGDGYGYRVFDLEIEIDGQDAIDIDFDVTKKAEANYENKLKKLDLEGSDAMDALNELFSHILITKDMPKDVVQEKILEYLEIDDYSQFDLDVHFDEGTLLEIDEVK